MKTPEELRRLADDLDPKQGMASGIAIPFNDRQKREHKAAAALRECAESLEREPKPVASIYISVDGSREVDDWRCDLPVGRNILFTAFRWPHRKGHAAAEAAAGHVDQRRRQK